MASDHGLTRARLEDSLSIAPNRREVDERGVHGNNESHGQLLREGGGQRRGTQAGGELTGGGGGSVE